MSELGKDVLFSTALVGSGAATALVLQSPLGMVGGAIVGGCIYINEKPFEWLSTKMFNTDKGTVSKISEIASFALSLIATTAINYAVVKELGFALAFKEVLALTAVTLLGAAAIASTFALVKLAVDKVFPKKQKELENQEHLKKA